jgi:hypothetical protein
VTIATAANEVFLVQQVDRNLEPGVRNSNDGLPGKGASYSFLKLNNEKRSIDFAATEADRGGFGVSWMFVKHNRVFQYVEKISVPWTNKELQVEYATFRDKTLPGSEEKWSVKIKGSKSDVVAAEMLASMYDASLDQFYPHQWYKPAIWPEYQKAIRWNGSNNFSEVELIYKGNILAE